MRIITWNINSIRKREAQALRLLDDVRPDVLCLQETKCPDPLFPVDGFVEAGYPHIVTRGMKGYNGVALISRFPFESTDSLDWVDRQDCRHVSARLSGGLEIQNFYVPAGGDVPDPDVNDKFDHKLKFLDEMDTWLRGNRRANAEIVLVGDLNIAPLKSDVWSHKQLLNTVCHTPVEVARLTTVQNSLGWIDTVRHITPEPDHIYTWWSYRARDWAASNRGRRLDHVWVTPPLASRIESAFVLREVRGWDKEPSDHAPVLVDLT